MAPPLVPIVVPVIDARALPTIVALASRILPAFIGLTTTAIGLILVTQRATFLPGSPAWAWAMLFAGCICLAVAIWPGVGLLRAIAGGLVATTYALRGFGVAWNASFAHRGGVIRASAMVGSLVWLEAAVLVVVVWLAVVIPGGEQWRSMRPLRASSPSSASSLPSEPS